MFSRATALTLTLLFASVLTVSAQETTSATPHTFATLTDALAHAPAAAAEPTVTLWSMSQAPQKRPLVLPVLYGSYGLFQAMDIVSTKRAIAAGAHEANPLGTSGNLGATIAIKAGTSAATFFAAEKLWKKNRVGAVLLMVAANGVSAAVVSHNLGNARR
jgi:hypothetical protein